MTAPPGSGTRRARSGGFRAGRFWSVRRIPAALTALLVLVVAGLFLYDLAAVRAHRPGMRWRSELGTRLAQYTPADTEVMVAAGILAAVGLLLLVLALTPGLRGLLAMRESGPDLRAGLARKAAAQVLRDRAMEVSGVQSARVKVGRSRIRVRAASHFRELDEVRADLDGALSAGVAELGLAEATEAALSRRVRVSRAPVGRKG